ncbi:PAS domain S-box protein [Rhodospirillum sp. A1_3_36]|uniref:PAS domain S-box protein n=1 Tax=Rhodospirillum sp. A1_3_36 TaxID=3391666 RepID=UPI0039A649CD
MMVQFKCSPPSDRERDASFPSIRQGSSIREWVLGVRESLPTAILILALDGLSRMNVTIPNPQLFLALAICIAAFRGGWGGGMAAAALGVGNALYFFSLPGELFSYSTTGLSKVAVNAVTLPGIAALTATLSHRVATGEHKHALSFFRDAEAPIVLMRLDGTILSWNRGMTRLTGISVEEAKERPIDHLVQTEDRAPLREALDAIVEGKTTVSLVLRFPLLGTSLNLPARLSCSLHPNRTETGRPSGIIMVGQALSAIPATHQTTDQPKEDP